MFKETDPENAAKVEALADSLAKLSIGEVLAYAHVADALKMDVRGQHRWLLDKARNVAEERLGCLFECERSIGVRRLESSAAPEVGLAAIGRIRRAAKRGKRRLGRLSHNSLSDPEVRRVVGYQAMLGAIATVADGRRAQTVGAVADPAKPIPPESILAMFTKPKKE